MQTVSRLTDNFLPDNYHLSMNLDREGRTFEGTVTMSGVLHADATHIIVHSKDLAISSVLVDGKAADFAASDNDELFITHPDLAEGRHIVVTSFSGSITDAMHGLYPCYFEHEGVKKELLATQFESHHAREVFPCIDEPAAKATFDVTLATEQVITVLGNMPVRAQIVEGNQLYTTFETTPKMSTYLLAWVIGDLHKKSAVTNGGVEVNVWATVAQPAESLDFALDIAVRTIDFYDEYFDTPYPLPKSDHVALPDFSSGAMENWGLITYREIALLADPATTSISSRHYIATVIAHELAHQWFGNLVTMKWWNDLWLNESFATLMEYIAVDALHPEWDIWLEFATSESIMALRRDSIDGVQAVQVDVHHPDEINTLFDAAIVYAKGARLLRMLQQYVGHEAFQTGLKAYFAEFAYDNTVGNDLWKSLSASSGKDISNFMNTWISQPGYPILEVAAQGSNISLKQKQFFIGKHSESEKLWPIPLNSSFNAMPELLESQEVVISHKHTTPLRFNVGDTAHFLTHYDENLLKQLIGEIQTGSLSPLDRLQLLHEQTLLARGGVMSSAQLIPLVLAYKHETTEPVWEIIGLCISELKKFVEDDAQSEAILRRLSSDLARVQYQRLGWKMVEGEPESDTKLRATIIGMMLYGEDADAISTASEMFQTTKLEKLQPELRTLIIGSEVRNKETSALIDNLLKKYSATNSADLQQDIASALTSTRSPATVSRFLSLITDGTTIRSQDTARWFVWLLRNREGRKLAWAWLQENWNWIQKKFGGDKSYDDYPQYAGMTLSTRQQLEEYTSFFTPMLTEPALTRVITMGISEIEARVELIERDSAAVQSELAKLAQ